MGLKWVVTSFVLLLLDFMKAGEGVLCAWCLGASLLLGDLLMLSRCPTLNTVTPGFAKCVASQTFEGA